MSAHTLGESLVRLKNRVPEEKKKGVVYEVPCLDCQQVYRGETGRTLQKRMAEHKTAVKNGNQNNGIAVHVWNSDQRIDWEEAKVRAVPPYYWERRVTEALHIQQQGSTMNLDCGLYVSPIWKPVIPALHPPPRHCSDTYQTEFHLHFFLCPLVLCVFILFNVTFQLHQSDYIILITSLFVYIILSCACIV